MDNPLVIGIVAWFFPGAGHFVQKRPKRGIIISASVWLMFVIGVLSGGAYYPGFDFKDGTLLYLLNVFATFEYGGRFLEVAGLLNYLAVIDAVDICLGRKK